LDKLKVKYKIVFENENILPFNPTHVILTGGPKHVYDEDHYKIPPWVINSNVPVLGICYQIQFVAHTLEELSEK